MQQYAREVAALLIGGAVLLGVADAVRAQSTQGAPGTMGTSGGASTGQGTQVQTAPGAASPYGQKPGSSSPANSSGTAPDSSSRRARTIDLNTITAEQLVRAGLDEPSAKLIVQNRPYTRPEEVLAVKGLPQQTREVLRANMDILHASGPAGASAPADGSSTVPPTSK
jgi:DNA uptake protein ComE-like DNA-binding protein